MKKSKLNLNDRGLSSSEWKRVTTAALPHELVGA